MRVKLREDWLQGAQVEVSAGLVIVAGRPCFEVDPQSDGYPALGQLIRNDLRVPVLLFMEAFWALRADQPLPLPWDWLEPIECFATRLPDEMPEGFAAEPLSESDALRDEGFEYAVKVRLTQDLWEVLSGTYDPALGLAELMAVLGFRGVLLPPNCPL
jgi:hypothetical protein